MQFHSTIEAIASTILLLALPPQGSTVIIDPRKELVFRRIEVEADHDMICRLYPVVLFAVMRQRVVW